jgi:hypothetical protein
MSFRTSNMPGIRNSSPGIASVESVIDRPPESATGMRRQPQPGQRPTKAEIALGELLIQTAFFCRLEGDELSLDDHVEQYFGPLTRSMGRRELNDRGVALRKESTWAGR